MKLKRKLQAIISYIRCPTSNFPRHFYNIWILWKSFLFHSIQTYLHLGEFLWTKYVRLIVCAVDWIKSRFSSGRILKSAASRLEFVTTRNHVDNLRLFDKHHWLYKEVCYDCYVGKHKQFFVWMPWRQINASLIHSPLFCEYAQRSLAEALEALDAVQGQKVAGSQLCCETNAKTLTSNRIRTKFIRFRVLHWKWLDNVLLLMLW
jgi:uncharacterized protein (DUF1810 family)